MYKADLHQANLTGAYLLSTNLRCANLSGVYFRGATEDYNTKLDLANVKNAVGMLNPNVLNETSNTVELDDSQWQDWKQSGFLISKLRFILGAKFPISAAAFDENFCQNGRSG